MKRLFCQIWSWSNLILCSFCAPLGKEQNNLFEDSLTPVNSDESPGTNSLVEIYTFNHAKCDGMDFRGIIILSKVGRKYKTIFKQIFIKFDVYMFTTYCP